MSVGEKLAAATNRFTDRVRDKRAAGIVEGEAQASGFDALEGHKLNIGPEGVYVEVTPA